ncbi:hypothetical protein V6N11_082623 [Hibiscus sabdariffa]|uniref:Uncharacterized protein n=1 Tax=Hibiscus sabdariffa TaxID=183260 RepID=A0ABR2P995_9ROSI
MGLGLGSLGLLVFRWTRFLHRNAWKNILIILHSTLCFLHLPRQESRQVLVSAALANSGSLVWSCISTTHVFFVLLLLPYASCAPQSA